MIVGSQPIIELVRANPGPVTIVAVDGHSAAGKSTLAANLAATLDAVVVHGDDFYRIMEPDTRAALTPAQGVALYYDWQRLRDQVLVPLKSGREGRYRPYDWTANALSADEVRVPVAGVVVVEGLFVSRPELTDLVDVTVSSRRMRRHESGDNGSGQMRRRIG